MKLSHIIPFFLAIIIAVNTLIAKNNTSNLLNIETITQVQDLPVIIIKSKLEGGEALALYISGDGGWNNFSQGLAEAYAANGISVIGLNSFKYFWSKKSPQSTADEIAMLLNKYLVEWHKKKIILCGYSFGADVIPFIYRRLPENLRNRITVLQLLSPASFTDFEIHVNDLFGSQNSVRAMNIAAELELLNLPIICYYGELEDEKPLSTLKKNNFKCIILPGGHRYKESYNKIVSVLSQYP